MTVPNKPAASKSSSNVRVVARIRPLSDKELELGSKESATSLAPSKDGGGSCEDADPNHTECLQVVDSGQKRFFELDRVYGPDCTQEEIYRGCGARQSVTEEIFKGFNCTILA